METASQKVIKKLIFWFTKTVVFPTAQPEGVALVIRWALSLVLLLVRTRSKGSKDDLCDLLSIQPILYTGCGSVLLYVLVFHCAGTVNFLLVPLLKWISFSPLHTVTSKGGMCWNLTFNKPIF